MAWVTICRRGKNKGKFKCRFTHSMLFALRLTTGDYLHNNPDDADVKSLYTALPIGCRDTLYLDVIHLAAIKKMLPKITNGGWTHISAVRRRIKSFDEIPALMLLASAALGDDS